MPYSAEISRSSPTCFLFLIDQSNSMLKPFGRQPDKKKSDGVADAINRLLQNLVIKCAKSEGVRDYLYVGVIGYGGQAAPVLAGTLAKQPILPISQIAETPLRVEKRPKMVPDGAGGLVEQMIKFPVWFEPKASGKTPMCEALTLARDAILGFTTLYPHCFPPLVLNITDGMPTDGDPRPSAAALQRLETSDGNVLLFNAHLSEQTAEPIEFPSSESDLADKFAKLLFRMSSPLPPKLLEAARGHDQKIAAEARGFVFNADLVSVIRFLDIGTRVAQPPSHAD